MSWIHRKALAVVVAGAAVATLLGATLGVAVAKHTSQVGGVCNGGSPGCNIHYVGAIRNNSVGPDSFTFTVFDGSLYATGTVSITVTPVNDAPTAVNDAYSVFQGSILTVLAGGVLTNDTVAVCWRRAEATRGMSLGRMIRSDASDLVARACFLAAAFGIVGLISVAFARGGSGPSSGDERALTSLSALPPFPLERPIAAKKRSMDALPRLFAGVLVGVYAEEEGPVGTADRCHMELGFWQRERFSSLGSFRLPQGASGGRGFDPASVTPSEFQELVRAILPPGIRLGDACFRAVGPGQPDCPLGRRRGLPDRQHDAGHVGRRTRHPRQPRHARRAGNRRGGGGVGPD